MILQSYLLKQNTPNFPPLLMWQYVRILIPCLSCSGYNLGGYHLCDVCSLEVNTIPWWSQEGALGVFGDRHPLKLFLSVGLMKVPSFSKLFTDAHGFTDIFTNKYHRLYNPQHFWILTYQGWFWCFKYINTFDSSNNPIRYISLSSSFYK